MHKRQLDDRIETCTQLINGKCNCGQPVVKVINSSCSFWKHGNRYHYPEETGASCIFRCRVCLKPIHITFIH